MQGNETPWPQYKAIFKVKKKEKLMEMDFSCIYKILNEKDLEQAWQHVNVCKNGS